MGNSIEQRIIIPIPASVSEIAYSHLIGSHIIKSKSRTENMDGNFEISILQIGRQTNMALQVLQYLPAETKFACFLTPCSFPHQSIVFLIKNIKIAKRKVRNWQPLKIKLLLHSWVYKTWRVSTRNTVRPFLKHI